MGWGFSQWHSHQRRLSAPLTKMPKIVEKSGKRSKNQEKERKNQEKEIKSGRKDQNREGSFTLPLLTDRARYAIYCIFCNLSGVKVLG